MDWNEVIAMELKMAGTGAVLEEVPDERRASAKSLMDLKKEIASQISENDAMCSRSLAYASSPAVASMF